MRERAKRYNSMDYMKGLMCIAVVLIHANFPDPLGQALKAIFRLAVPFFFFVSGFFLLESDLTINRRTILRKICNIVKILFQAGLFYVVFTNLKLLVSSESADLREYVAQKLDFGSIIKFFVTNDPFVYSALWFMLALVYGYLTILVFSLGGGYRPNKICLAVFTALGFAGYLALTEWKTALHLSATISISGTEKTLVLSNLYLFRAMPFLLLGMLMRMEEPRISRWDENKTVCLCVIGIVGGSILAVVERFLSGDAMFYAGTYLALISCAVLAVRKPELGNRFWTTMGNRYSLFVYLYHTAVIDTINYIFNQKLHIYISTNLLYAYTRPLIVLAITLVAAGSVHALQDGWARMSSPAPRKQSDAVR